MEKTNNTPIVSVVIPVFNEEDNLRALWQKLEPAVEDLGVSYEVIFVDDGSRDASFSVLAEIRRTNPKVRVIRLRRNYGQHPATIAGFDHAHGRWVLTLDADLQNDPADLKVILAKLQEGHDVVAGVRTNRQDPFLRRKLPSRIVNKFIAERTGLVQTDTGCFLKGYTLKAAQEVAEYTDIGGFITASIGALGFKYAEVPVGHAERFKGQSRYGILTQLDQFMSLFTGYARRPFQIIEIIGACVVVIGVLVMLVTACAGLRLYATQLLLGLIVTVLGLILGSVGVVGEYTIRIARLTRRSPRYLIRELLE
ncbi:MAG: glycosyltransferase family 2 protein [Verrucomicrobiia bacterium]|jgi:undecaprenyl-phosphate 4-deoxy-4-formamido-L-arabinose transferase